MGKPSRYHEAFQRHLASHFDYIPHAIPGRKGFTPEDHQRNALQELYEGLTLSRTKMCAVASCGSGKTLVEIASILASQKAKEELEINNNRKDILVTEGRSVVLGIRRQFEALGIETGIWSGGKKELEPSVIVASVNSLQMANSRKDLTKNISQGSVDLCVIDEVDRFLTKSRTKVVDALHPRITAGFTATEEWPDGRHISDRFGPIVHRLPLKEGIRQKINALPEYLIYQSEILESDLKLKMDDYDPTHLAAAWKQAEIHKAIPEVYRHIVPDDKRKLCPTLVYVPSRELVWAVSDTLNHEFNDEDITAVGLTGEDETETIESTTSCFLNGEIQIIVLCEMGGRGMNLENAQLLIDAFPTKSLNKLEQRHGRVLRKIRPGSTLWNKGWRKKEAVIAQIIPKSNQFRPALFTDIIGGWKELQRIRGEVEADRSEVGAPQSDLIAEIRERIESKNPPAHLQLVRKVDVLEMIMRDLPQADEDGFLYLPRRYVRKEENT